MSQPTDTSGGEIKYDLGSALSGGQFQRTWMLDWPPKVLLNAFAGGAGEQCLWQYTIHAKDARTNYFIMIPHITTMSNWADSI